jgi:hypothetical protein
MLLPKSIRGQARSYTWIESCQKVKSACTERWRLRQALRRFSIVGARLPAISGCQATLMSLPKSIRGQARSYTRTVWWQKVKSAGTERWRPRQACAAFLL